MPVSDIAAGYVIKAVQDLRALNRIGQIVEDKKAWDRGPASGNSLEGGGTTASGAEFQYDKLGELMGGVLGTWYGNDPLLKEIIEDERAVDVSVKLRRLKDYALQHGRSQLYKLVTNNFADQVAPRFLIAWSYYGQCARCGMTQARIDLVNNLAGSAGSAGQAWQQLTKPTIDPQYLVPYDWTSNLAEAMKLIDSAAGSWGDAIDNAVLKPDNVLITQCEDDDDEESSETENPDCGESGTDGGTENEDIG